MTTMCSGAPLRGRPGRPLGGGGLVRPLGSLIALLAEAMLRSRGKLGLSHATDMNSNDAVLVISGEWASTHGGISTLNRHRCTALASQGLSVYCVVLTATPREHADAAARGVTLIEILTDTHSPELA